MVCGELSDALLDHLSALSSEVFLPLISGRGGNAEKALPGVVAKGVTDSLQKFVVTGGWLCRWDLWEPRACRQPYSCGRGPACSSRYKRVRTGRGGSCMRTRVSTAPPAVNVTAGQLRNQTVLPLPPVSEAQLADEGGGRNKETLHLLESAVVTWTRQIKQVCRARSVGRALAWRAHA